MRRDSEVRCSDWDGDECTHLSSFGRTGRQGGGVGNLSGGKGGWCRSSSQVASGGFEMHLGVLPESLGKCGEAEILTTD